MADQNITELPIKTNTGVASTDYMLGIDSAEGYQILVRDVAKYIVENYNGSTLAGSAQPVKDAVNILDDMSYKTLSEYYNKDIIPYLTALRKGTYFVRIDNVTGFPITGSVVYRITKVNNVGDTRCSILAIPMNANNPDIYTAFVPQNATTIKWIKQPTRAEVTQCKQTSWGTSLTIQTSGVLAHGILLIGGYPAVVWCPSTADVSVTAVKLDGTIERTQGSGSVTFTAGNTSCTLARDGKTLTLTTGSSISITYIGVS